MLVFIILNQLITLIPSYIWRKYQIHMKKKHRRLVNPKKIAFFPEYRPKAEKKAGQPQAL